MHFYTIIVENSQKLVKIASNEVKVSVISIEHHLGKKSIIIDFGFIPMSIECNPSVHRV